MASNSHTADEKHGYCFHLPPLGLPDLAGEWVPLRAATGTKQACTEMLLRRHIAAPHRHPDAQHEVFELEYDNAIWTLPLLASRVSQKQKADLFTVLAHRMATSLMPERRGARIPAGVQAIFVRSSSQQDIDCDLDEKGDSDASYMETTELLRICRDPTRGQCLPTPQQRNEWIHNGEAGKAFKAWSAIYTSFVNEGWVKEVVQEGADAGLAKDIGTGFESCYTIRAVAEPDAEGRGLEYALKREDDYMPPPPPAWKPVPAYAFPLDYVRAGVNLVRLATGYRLLTKEEWPAQGAAAYQPGAVRREE